MISHQLRFHVYCLSLIFILASIPAQAATPAFCWLESESPTTANISYETDMRHEFISGTWLKVMINPDKIDQTIPAEGISIKYNLTVDQPGQYEIWNHIGWDSIRTTFQWRIDNGDWQTIIHDTPTIDLMELGEWCEISWLQMGTQQLTKGTHTLEIKPIKEKDKDNKYKRIVYTSDALCLYKGHFQPHSKFKPGENWQKPIDTQAQDTLFKLPNPTKPAQRITLPLNGLWQIARHDELIPAPVDQPIKDLPDTPYWQGIQVPSDKNQNPDLKFAHRLWYRTVVDIPADSADNGFFLVFPQNNLNTTVYVNKTFCGFDKNPFARIQFDVSKAIKPGKNEILVGIRDAWYAFSANPDNPFKLRNKFYLPIRFFHEGFQDLAYPIWNHAQSGILVTPELVMAGSVYTADTFCQPSVDKMQLKADITITNPTNKVVTGQLLCAAKDLKTSQTEKRFKAIPFQLNKNETKTLTLNQSWPNAKLWWPDTPQMYNLETTISINNKPVDTALTSFGFRQWSWQGRDYKLNGIPWHGWADCFTADNKENWLKFYRDNNETMMRFWGTRWKGMAPEQALSFFDENGVVCRRSGILDGEMIGYMAIENDPALREKYNSDIKIELLNNWHDQMIAQVKGERNHPSVMIWSIENEYLYINCINLYGSLMDKFEAEVTRTANAVMQADPTRPVMVDGGGATKNNTLPVHGDHYVVAAYPEYPTIAYTPYPEGGGRGRWLWDQQRPRFIGEDFYLTGNDPGLSYFGGEEAFQGKASTRPAASILARILTEGYRWANQNAWHFWLRQSDAPDQYISYSAQAAFCRQWNWTFASGQTITRTIGLFNDTRYDDPLMFKWTLSIDGKTVAQDQSVHKLPAGTSKKFDIEITLPKVKSRTEADLALIVLCKNKEVFRDTKQLSILNPQGSITPALRAAKPTDIAIYDPDKTLSPFLTNIKIKSSPITSLENLPKSAKLILIAPNAISQADSTSSTLAAAALNGQRIIVLDQQHPLFGQALHPAIVDTDQNLGRTAFIENQNHPALTNLKDKDFFTFPGSEIVYKNAYLKPNKNARSLIQCHTLLKNSALLEIPIDQGLLILSQLNISETLNQNATAQQLLINLLNYGLTYKLAHRNVTAFTADNQNLSETIDNIGLKYANSNTPLDCLTKNKNGIAIIDASPATLKKLTTNQSAVKSFTQNGGWIILNNLTPDGLNDYNTLVGFDHMIRPFRRERVTYPTKKHWLTSGLTLADVALYSSQRIFPWTVGNYVSNQTFSYIVDYEDVAPFAHFESENMEHPDWNLSNLVNGMVSADAWKYIVNRQTDNNKPIDFQFNFPKPVEIREVEWTGNTFYYPVTQFQLIFDNNAQKALSFDTKPDNSVQTFSSFTPTQGKNITLRLNKWDIIPGKNNVTGLDNIRLLANRDDAFYQTVQPMLNVGGLMAYPQGKGGIILCNVNFKTQEDVPDNKTRKQNIIATILRNLNAPFASGKTIIPGETLTYTPIDLSKHANQYRTDRGWFGDKNFTFKDIPTGRQTFAGVTYNIYDFATSPVPTVIMLKGRNTPNQLPDKVQNIPVNQTADALFFLHTMRLDNPMNDRDRREKKQFETLRYSVHYADGQSIDIPIIAEHDIHNYKQQSPTPLPGAQIAWTNPYPGTNENAVAYSKQWDNPRPQVKITSIDMQYGQSPRGVPVLIALTAAKAK